MFTCDNYCVVPIDFEQQKKENPNTLIYETHIHKISYGKPVPVIFETGFMYHKWSQFAPMNSFGETNDQRHRNWIKFPINPKEINCLKLEEEINDLDDFILEEQTNMLGKFEKLFEQRRSIYEPKTQIELTQNFELGASEIKPKYLKLKFRQKCIYYWKEKLLDFDNSNSVKRAVYRSFLHKYNFQLVKVCLAFKNDAGQMIPECVSLSDIKMKKVIDTALFYRNVESVPLDAKKVEDCSEDELIKYYGKPVLQTINSAEDIDKYFCHNSYVRAIFSAKKINAFCNKYSKGIREYNVNYVCESIDIIHIKQNYIQKKDNLQYKNYVFRKGKNVEQD